MIWLVRTEVLYETVYSMHLLHVLYPMSLAKGLMTQLLLGISAL
jgi:hypothetical protein